MDPLPIGHVDEQYNVGTLFTILPEARRKHMAVFGTTGAGKSTLLRNMVAWDIAAGLGVTVIDPHGALVDDILDNHIPRIRTNDVIYFNPKDHARALGMNVLESVRPEQKALMVSQVVSIFKKLWSDSWGPRLEDILRNSLFALIEQPEPVSLVALPRLLSEAAYRARILARVQNPVVQNFFTHHYENWKETCREEAISPVLNKIRAFLTDPLLLSIIGQTRSSFDFRWMMDRGKILLCDLSKGAIGDDNANLLGSLIVTKEKLAALSRGDTPETARRLHFLYVEEAQNFVGDFPSILSEARKYGLALVLATQGIEQLSRESAFAVFANCATLVSFRVSGHDARRLKEEFAMVMPAEFLQDLPDYKIYVRTMTTDPRGAARPSGPHQLDTLPPLSKMKTDTHRARVERTALQRYARPRARIEKRIARFLNGQERSL